MLRQILKHLLYSPRSTKNIFSNAGLQQITQAIQIAEKETGTQICFMIESALPLLTLFKKKSVKDRALEIFSRERIWDTEQNNGILIYLLLAERDIEFIVDRGISAKISDGFWSEVCLEVENKFKHGQFVEAIIACVEKIKYKLKGSFPVNANPKNEIADAPSVF